MKRRWKEEETRERERERDKEKTRENANAAGTYVRIIILRYSHIYKSAI